MAKVVGNIEWQAQPNYPRYTGEANNERIDAKFVAAIDQVAENLPNYGAAFLDERFPYLNSFSSLRLSSRSIVPLPGSTHCEISLTYSSPEAEPDDGDEDEEYINVENQVPIEQHKNYRKCWNYDLHAKKGVTSVPIWYPDAQKDHTISSSESSNYKWVRCGEQPASGWYVVQPAIKPGVETFKTFVPEVHYKKYSHSKSSLARVADKDGTKQTPPDTYGRSGEWLQDGSAIRKEGRMYALEVAYLNSRVIDSDIYD